MCGISGVVATDGQPITGLARQLDRMNRALAHRGPDGEGQWSNPSQTAGLAHRRLAIVDVNPRSNQPMVESSGRYTLVFNGEIYNHRQIRTQLEQKGFNYHTESDTETILYAYQTWGPKCVDHFRGMFALAIWDEERQELFLARDRLGVKPLYYGQFNGRFYFASEPKAILTGPKVPRQVDEEALYHYLTFFVAPAPRTLFAGISKLPPGYWAKLDRHRHFETHRYWDALGQEDQQTPAEDWPKVVRSELKESVRLRLMSDVPFGAYLSGGVDSSAITVLMNELLHQPIETFTVVFKGQPKLDESGFAKQISREYQMHYHQTKISKAEFYRFYPALLQHQDDPASDWVSFPLYWVSKLIRDNGVVVAQVGEGSDELFAGYRGYFQFEKLDRLYRRLVRLPRPFRVAINDVAQLLYKIRPARFLPEFGRRLVAREELFWGGAIAFTEFEKNQLLGEKLRGRYNSHQVVAKIYQDFDQAGGANRDRLARMTYLELKNRLAELLLMRVDRMAMAWGIEARVPFLDHQFVERMITIPRAVRVGAGPKAVLKQALRGVIPDNIIDRPKLGFHAPIAEWLKLDERFQRFIYHSIVRSPLVKNGLLNRDYIDWLFTTHRHGRADCSVQIWCLMTLTGWHRCWIEGKTK